MSRSIPTAAPSPTPMLDCNYELEFSMRSNDAGLAFLKELKRLPLRELENRACKMQEALASCRELTTIPVTNKFAKINSKLIDRLSNLIIVYEVAMLNHVQKIEPL